ncbi:ROK family protein [Hamadaea tsunoensis]|uniref:ROK family protein n=1 Tax=Hamadaea tsunoensis TaxID=53368 RepID=UPI00041559EC|nr:ROK family protein [Hamadaea tsunoensis]
MTAGPDHDLVIGVDIGGTKTAVAAVDGDGRAYAIRVAPTPAAEGAAAILDTAARLADEVRREAVGTIAAVGVGAPGVVDARRGVVVSATDLLRGWAGTPVADLLSERLGLPVAVDNDVRAAGLGEARHGTASTGGLVLVVAVGTGIGGAVVREGVLLPGFSGVAGHLGHIPVPGVGDDLCSCGRRDHLEAAAAGPAILRAARRAGLPVTTTAEVIALAESDPRAATVVTHAATVLGRALGGVANLLDPETVVVGGGVAEAGDVWWQPLRAAFHAELLPPAAPALTPAVLGTRAGVIGAAALARDLVNGRTLR